MLRGATSGDECVRSIGGYAGLADLWSRVALCMSAAEPIVVACYLPETQFTDLRARLPAGVVMVELPREDPWRIPDGASVMLTFEIPLPSNGGAPSGWPFDLSWFHTMATGIEWAPPWLFAVAVTCGRGGVSEAVAEFAMASMLAATKRLPEAWLHSRDEWRPIELSSLMGATIGLLGFGAVGQAIARRALPFGAQLLAHRRDDRSAEVDGVRLTSLDEVAEASDHIVIALPETRATHGLVDKRLFGLMRPGVHLVNVSRGAVVDHDALIRAVDCGRVGLATLDVTEPEPLPVGDPLYMHPRVRISPHVAWRSPRSVSSCSDVFVRALEGRMAGGDLPNLVDRERGY